MSPTVFREGAYRFFFFSREENRPHVHVQSADGEAKFWLEPEVLLATSHGLSRQDLTKIEVVIQERKDEILRHWHRHFGA